MKWESSSRWYVLGLELEMPMALLGKGFWELDSAIRAICGDDLYLTTSRMKEPGIEMRDGKVRSKRAEEIYEKAIRAIKSGRLRGREVDERESEGGEFVAVKFNDGRAWYLNPKPYGMQVLVRDFLEWALIERIPITDVVSQTLGFSKQYQGKFHPQKVALQATAQVVWYHEPLLSIVKLEKHPLIQQILGHAYSSKNSFRDIVKMLDPRPGSERGKLKTRERLEPVRYPPKPIPDISNRENGNFLALKTACRALFNALKHLAPTLASRDFLSHPLVELCLISRNDIIKDMAVDWLAEVEADFPLPLVDF